MPKALDDILTVSVLIGGCVFSFAKLVCRHFAAVHTHIAPRQCKMVAHASLANEKTHPLIKILTVEISPRALGMM